MSILLFEQLDRITLLRNLNSFVCFHLVDCSISRIHWQFHFYSSAVSVSWCSSGFFYIFVVVVSVLLDLILCNSASCSVKAMACIYSAFMYLNNGCKIEYCLSELMRISWLIWLVCDWRYVVNCFILSVINRYFECFAI